MTQYRNKISWIHPASQRITLSRPSGNSENGWIRCDSQFEGRVGLAIYRWCCQYDWKFKHHVKVQLNDGQMLLKPRFWTADFVVTKGGYRLIIEAKGQVDQRFKDVLTMLENVGKLNESLIVVAQSKDCRDDLMRLFRGESPYPVKIIVPTNLFRTLDQTAKVLGQGDGVILP
ncbi:hypothetical protein PN466_00795 [Roseofilum reptotaenium CS-1145]|uniref:Uncharacterized protein n=1 Tax=Roseofilum reptotaenium AO1-A TaxID=1925591 RepID=A0A1L9QKN2_9CYAN|nr:hypothetical protein [Roseofilum reptotaenium]MDB9515499.1 hypothetical protein [Roseofilum reptotaenium CS-1145]OJJ16936.1 hypothetical protein BI308_23255 [Roseofilum reptotaenium AO1-A]